MDTLISLAHVLSDEVGPGYDKSLYCRAFEVLLREQGVQYECNKFFPVMLHSTMIGSVEVDIFVGDCAVVIRTCESIDTKLCALVKHVPHVLLIHFPPDSDTIIRQIS